MSKDDKAYMEYLDEVFYEGYGLLLYKGDTIAFEVGKREWLAEKETENEA